ncbi:hypothetical protein PPYR_01417 [Photinus pyralis]|uniref:Uncharacterized protein n=1 Tax=Photinus pyralis TaxID=7054 RepID=A0A5N4B4A4_PHOPY|nr:hypothetical protein PPYR_01417 [Photinus pyralis]
MIRGRGGRGGRRGRSRSRGRYDNTARSQSRGRGGSSTFESSLNELRWVLGNAGRRKNVTHAQWSKLAALLPNEYLKAHGGDRTVASVDLLYTNIAVEKEGKEVVIPNKCLSVVYSEENRGSVKELSLKNFKDCVYHSLPLLLDAVRSVQDTAFPVSSEAPPVAHAEIKMNERKLAGKKVDLFVEQEGCVFNHNEFYIISPTPSQISPSLMESLARKFEVFKMK